ncbi:MAG: hypothetical protein KAY32_15580 [Candidatus Eisenbacteria sp.]|nr:hypothetical protein [Candidatus Eisenbacteria bacterium]
MAMLNKNRCKNFVYQFFLTEGWLPPGTTPKNWSAVTIGELGIDDPPLPSDPHLQKRRVALDLQNFFALLGGKLPSPLSQLKRRSLTLGGFADWCHANQEG